MAATYKKTISVLITIVVMFVGLLWFPEEAYAAVSISQTANPAGVAASSNIATYSNVSIGTAADDRRVVVVVGTELANSTPSAATIDYGSGDVTMTPGTSGNFGAMYTQVFHLVVPTGTTATIKVTYSSTSPGDTANHIAVYKVTGSRVSSSNSDGSTDMDATDPLTTGSVTIPANGGFIAVAAGATDTVSKTWANATGDIDADAGTFRFNTATRVTSGTVAVTATGGTNNEDGALSYLIFDVSTSPTVTTGSSASITSSSFNVNSNDITSVGGSAVTERGVVYMIGSSGDPTTSDSKSSETGTFVTGTYNRAVTSLSPNTAYRVRAFATNALGTSYGTSITVTTSVAAPAVTTNAASSVTTSSATLNGDITSTGGETGTGTQHGFAWGTNINLSGGDTATTTLGTYSGTGAFTGNLSLLTSSVTYYFRAYTTNSAGTSYGSIVNFTTSAAAVTPSRTFRLFGGQTVKFISGRIILYPTP